ncbi:cobalt-precorrin-6A reductase [Inediibacterium massiliense]|uniref:cobalt-precorrin-6A reductase n=1 Tax=Inediibacterium massiliense TaxID=1658111 RepID=UPI0006B56692|nr:cobalt-precorrin-6A reductase [Inediibacterium massiliense]
MIMILSGTQDGREIVDQLQNLGYPLLVTTATAYGAELIPKNNTSTVIHKKLSKEEMEEIIINKNVKILIDATHPYAVEVSQNAIDVCKKMNICYLRFQRKESLLFQYEEIIDYVSDYEEAADKLNTLNGNILLTTGSKTLEVFTKKIDIDRLFPRVLPVSNVIQKCEDLNIKPSHIIAMQGPFSTQMNMEIIKKYKIDILVSKDSGDYGGTIQKLEAAKKMNVFVVMIQRPKLNYPHVFDHIDYIIDKVRKIYE